MAIKLAPRVCWHENEERSTAERAVRLGGASADAGTSWLVGEAIELAGHRSVFLIYKMSQTKQHKLFYTSLGLPLSLPTPYRSGWRVTENDPGQSSPRILIHDSSPHPALLYNKRIRCRLRFFQLYKESAIILYQVRGEWHGWL